VALLKQSNIDSAKLAEVISVSDSQLEFVNNSPSGTGLIKCGSVVIPFDNTIGKDTELYKLYNTNMHEKAEELKNQAETMQAMEEMSADEDSGVQKIGAASSIISKELAVARTQKVIVPESAYISKVEQPAAKYNSWMIY
jgi:hypothetical protein